MATRNKYTNGAYIRSGHIKILREIGQRSRPRLISVSPRISLHGIWICIEYRWLISLATVVHVLEPGEKVTH